MHASWIVRALTVPWHDVHPLRRGESTGREACLTPFLADPVSEIWIRRQSTSHPHRFGALWCERVQGESIMGTKVRFSVSLSDETNDALEALAADHKPALSKSYLVEYAVLRLLSAIKSKQLALPLLLGDEDSAR